MQMKMLTRATSSRSEFVEVACPFGPIVLDLSKWRVPLTAARHHHVPSLVATLARLTSAV